MGNEIKKDRKVENSKKSNDDEEQSKKSQKVKILVSTWRFGEKIVSALGIPRSNAPVEHRIDKKNLREDEIFNIISSLSTDTYYNRNQAWNATVKFALDKTCSELPFPSQNANEFSKKPIGKLTHEILTIEIELFVK